MVLPCGTLKININFIPWREEKRYKNNKLIFIYSFIFIIILIFLILIKSLFFVKLDNIKNNNKIINYNKTLWLVNFLYAMPNIIKSDIYLNKILINNDYIKINILTNNIDNIEKFLEKIKKQGGVKKINIDSGENTPGYKNESKENKFIITIYPVLLYNNINKLNNIKYNNKIISKIYKISVSNGVYSDIYISNYIYIKSIGSYKNLIKLLINITKEFKNLLIFSLSIHSVNIEEEYNNNLNMNIVFKVD